SFRSDCCPDVCCAAGCCAGVCCASVWLFNGKRTMLTNAIVAMVLMICIRHLRGKGFSFTRARQMPESPGKLFRPFPYEPPLMGILLQELSCRESWETQTVPRVKRYNLTVWARSFLSF